MVSLIDGHTFNKLPYCSRCGEKTELIKKFSKYSTETGEKLYRYFARCVNYNSLQFWNSHSDFEWMAGGWAENEW